MKYARTKYAGLFDKHGALGWNRLKKAALWLFRACIIIGISYVILGPLISLISRSVMPLAEFYSPLVFVVPMTVTGDHFRMAIQNMDYWHSLFTTLIYCAGLTALQVLVSASVGYGFARYKLPLSKLMFALVVLTIVVPSQSLLVPMYMQFRFFDPLGLISLFGGRPVNLIDTGLPMAMMTALGVGLNTGLYIYIFRQFFRGMPAALEEAAWIDGSGAFKTFFRIMLPNAAPSIIIVLLFSLVWQYNDTFFSGLFSTGNTMLSGHLSSLQSMLTQVVNIRDVNLVDSVMKTGVLLMIVPLIVIYLVLQRYFMESIERSGIVG